MSRKKSPQHERPRKPEVERHPEPCPTPLKPIPAPSIDDEPIGEKTVLIRPPSTFEDLVDGVLKKHKI